MKNKTCSNNKCGVFYAEQTCKFAKDYTHCPYCGNELKDNVPRCPICDGTALTCQCTWEQQQQYLGIGNYDD